MILRGIIKMTHLKIEKQNIDIYICPEADINNVKQLTIGDLHANAMFLMHFLVTNGIVKIDSDTYSQLTNIYRKITLTKQDISDFNAIIDTLEIGEKPLLRLIGDEICDRGQNDYFIFKILNKLHQSGVRTEILLSNHGIEFLIPYENQQELYAPNIDTGNQAQSLNTMRTLIEKNIITREEVDVLIRESYLPNLKLLSYSVDRDSNAITIFSHAGIGLQTIQSLAQKFQNEGVIYNDNTVSDLATTIDAINSVFANYVNKGKVYSLTSTYPFVSENDPVTFLIWNRNYFKLRINDKDKKYQLYYAHGHDSGELTRDNIFNLDNSCFKGVTNNVGQYMILGSNQPVAELLPNVSTLNNSLDLKGKGIKQIAKNTIENESLTAEDLLNLNKWVRGVDEVIQNPHDLKAIQKHHTNTQEVISMNTQWAKLIAGAMLSFLGVALIGVAIVFAIGTFGGSTPLSAAGFALGWGMVASGFTVGIGMAAGLGLAVGLGIFANSARKEMSAMMLEQNEAGIESKKNI